MLPDFSPKKSGRLEEPHWPARFKPLGFSAGNGRARSDIFIDVSANAPIEAEPQSDDNISIVDAPVFENIQVIDEPMRYHDMRADYALSAPLEEVEDADTGDANMEPTIVAEAFDHAAASEAVAHEILGKIDSAINELGAQLSASLNDGVVNMFSAIARKSMHEEGLSALQKAISKIVPSPQDVTISITGPAALLTQLKTIMDADGSPQWNAEFIENEQSTDVIARYEKTSLSTRFAELEQMLAEIAQ